jgi:hypothetical protein
MHCAMGVADLLCLKKNKHKLPADARGSDNVGEKLRGAPVLRNRRSYPPRVAHMCTSALARTLQQWASFAHVSSMA